jgi:hypothetical protein
MKATLIVIITTGLVTTCLADSRFATLIFGKVSVEVPVNWIYLNEDVRSQLSTGTESTFKLADIPLDLSKQGILVAAGIGSQLKGNAATFRLTVDPQSGMSQSDTKAIENEKLSQDVLEQIMWEPMKQQLLAGLRAAGEDQKLSFRKIEFHTINGIHWFSMQYLRTPPNGDSKIVEINQAHLDDMALKFTISYRESETALFRTTLDRIWRSITIK